ncbi:hypothetical protein GE061_012347 [Apolygus lucorum]|uniref:Uncharacterized protein n=1 Tax=Apolygus lucorum TaxID=248454 RepID=A0A8S9XU55_APOLU|nr:hypothetical protein GE061_012347 [Apolygus lucorum]
MAIGTCIGRSPDTRRRPLMDVGTLSGRRRLVVVDDLEPSIEIWQSRLNLQVRERALKSILESLHLNLSGLDERGIEATSEILMKQGMSEVSRENIIESHIKKTLKNDENLQINKKLILQRAEIENERIVLQEWNSTYSKAVKTYKQGIQKTNEELSQNVGSTVLSPENKHRPSSNFQQRDLQRNILKLCGDLYKQKKMANYLHEKLSAFGGLPTDVESANQEVYLKKWELEHLGEQMEELLNTTDRSG